MTSIEWKCVLFDKLSVQELYDIMALRAEVFVVEQDCPYQDPDGKKDYNSHHMMGYRDGQLLAYARLVAPDISYKEPSIGRIVTSSLARGTGAGIELMDESIEKIIGIHGDLGIRISAQCYLIPFYQKFHFEPVGEEYLEDNIPHIQMFRNVGLR